MKKIYLNNLLHFDQVNYGDIKIKFNQSNGYEDPMELYTSLLPLHLKLEF
jgi:hypothetical protein